MLVDGTGAPVTGGYVSVSDLDSGWSSSAPIGPDGRYTVLGLAPGSYRVHIGAPDAASALASTPAYAVRFANADSASGVAFMAEFPRRLFPATLRLKELIATRLGKPRRWRPIATTKP